jgi:N-acetylglutamate synthase-like GNAT family acetyltransferase
MRADYEALVHDGAVTVAVERRTIVGVLVLQLHPDELLLEIVAVAPAAQGRGIGRALIAFAEQRARKLNLRKVTLYTNAEMTENLALYRRLEFVEWDGGVSMASTASSSRRRSTPVGICSELPRPASQARRWQTVWRASCVSGRVQSLCRCRPLRPLGSGTAPLRRWSPAIASAASAAAMCGARSDPFLVVA